MEETPTRNASHLFAWSAAHDVAAGWRAAAQSAQNRFRKWCTTARSLRRDRRRDKMARNEWDNRTARCAPSKTTTAGLLPAAR